jgi:hypothetical protein
MSSTKPSTASSASDRIARRLGRRKVRAQHFAARAVPEHELQSGATLAGRQAHELGSAAVEFVLVGTLLTVLTLAVLQLGLALHVRNTVLDAAAEGARVAGLGDNGLAEGIARTEDLIRTAIGGDYAKNVRAGYEEFLGVPATVITVRTALPLIGLIGLDETMEVSGHAARESLG